MCIISSGVSWRKGNFGIAASVSVIYRLLSVKSCPVLALANYILKSLEALATTQ